MTTINIKEAVAETAAKTERRLVKALVFKARGDVSDKEEIARTIAHSKGIPDDPFETIHNEILDPPYDPRTLIELTEMSVALSGAIESMEVNVPGFGYSLVSAFPNAVPEDKEEEVQIERLQLENDLAIFPRTESLTMMRRKLRRDLEITGNAYLEIIRNPGNDDWVAGRRIKSYRMRMMKEDDELTAYELVVPKVMPDGSIDTIKIPHAKRFRRFVEAVASASGTTTTISYDVQHRYYKEFGDPRVLDNETGNYVSEEDQKKFEETNKPMPEHRKAAEVYHFGDSDRSPYGIPRWIAALPSVLGGRSGELTNLYTLQNHGIPSMVVTVSNGRLTTATVERIQDYVDDHVKGNANYSTFLVLEGEGEYEGEDSGQTKIDITPLADAQIRDMLFGDYISTNEARASQAFRIPQLFQGKTENLNKATAELVRALTDEQVFAPERSEDDWFYNYVLFPNWKVQYHRFETNSPNVTDNRDLIAMATALERTGAMTPRIGRRIGAQVFPQLVQLMQAFKDGIEPDKPFSLQMAEAVKNMANPTEVGQQVAPVMPPENPDEIVEARAHLVKFFGELEEAADAELRRFLKMRRADDEDE
jgi:PBSX family phage portal protein